MTAGNQLTAGKAIVGDVQFKGGSKGVRVGSFTLTGTATTTGGAIGSWANPEGQTIIIMSCVANITTKATVGTPGLDLGPAADATTSNDTLIDGKDIGTAAGCFNNTDDQGTNGKVSQQMTSGQYVTASSSASTAGAVGTCYITYALA